MMIQNVRLKWFITIVVLALPAAAAQAALIEIETVPVGNLGNTADMRYNPDQQHPEGFGSVGYAYNIGKYEVTAWQYTEFLNAVAATDTYGLYYDEMWSDHYGYMIQQNGSSGSYSYSVESDWAYRPVNFVSWSNAARFANWLHNGQPTGAQDPTTTEDGSYDLSGWPNSIDWTLTRKSDATWVIPTENEWYKAAYHKNDGVTGNYFDYPTSSDIMPSNVLVEPTDPGNNATLDGTIGSPYYRTEIGAHENSESPYGTFDQGGNVMEWTETWTYGWNRICRGGFFGGDGSVWLHASAHHNNDWGPKEAMYMMGFRVAQVPEPGTITLLACGLLAGLVWWGRGR